MPRLAATAAVALVLAGCAPGPNPAFEPQGPVLVVDVRNASERGVEIAYEFTGGVMSGTGASLVEPCQRSPLSAGKLSGGTYSIQVDGKTVLEATMPAGAPDAASLVVSVLIGPDGEVEVLPPSLVETPELDVMPMPGCR